MSFRQLPPYTRRSIGPTQGTEMGVVHGDFTLVNLFTLKQVKIRAMIDTGSTNVLVTFEVARELGFDPDEVSRGNLIVADCRRVQAPRLRPIEIHFEDRSCLSDVFVLGDECLVGVIPLEDMDLVVDPKRQIVITNPAHPDGPYKRA
jgi:predicted aspartyl protease